MTIARDLTYSTLNYEERGGARWVIAGELAIIGGKITNAGVQAGAVTPLATTASTQTSPWGFASQAQADAIHTAVNAIIVALQGVGLLP